MMNAIVRVFIRRTLLSQQYFKHESGTVDEVAKDNFAFFPAMTYRLI